MVVNDFLPGRLIVRIDLAGTAVFTVSSVLAAIVFDGWIQVQGPLRSFLALFSPTRNPLLVLLSLLLLLLPANDASGTSSLSSSESSIDDKSSSSFSLLFLLILVSPPLLASDWNSG